LSSYRLETLSHKSFGSRANNRCDVHRDLGHDTSISNNQSPMSVGVLEQLPVVKAHRLVFFDDRSTESGGGWIVERQFP
jgi:hypothetical protein